jgi:Flp pilus assembly pilin Flp|tara:strand:- start:901 stop:3600 length:2700 start_codon:yes stop_codon:yes gene_type:complete
MKSKLLYSIIFLAFSLLSYSQVQIGQDIDGKYGGYQFGRSVSSSSNSNIIAIGSPNRGLSGAASSGHVRVYENISGVWTQIGQDINGEAEYDRFGTSVSLSSNGNILAIGAPGNDGNGESSGHVRVYENISGVWTQVGQDIDGTAIDDFSGTDVSISNDGSIVAIGAPGNDTNGENSTQVKVYENISGVWTQIGQDINGEAAGDAGFFINMSLSLSNNGNILAIGAPGNDGNGESSGHVRVYENISGVWTQIGQDIDGETTNNFSGTDVSISSDGNTIAIGAHYNNGSSGFDFYIGLVRIYENISGVWTQIGQDIYGNDALDNSGFSVSLSSDGSKVAIGAPYFNNNGGSSGFVHIYENISGVWIQIGQDIYGEDEYDRNGMSISFSSDGNKVVVGAPSNTNYIGKVNIYEYISGVWTQIGQSIVGDLASEHCGSNVTLSSNGNILAVGSRGNDDNGENTGQVRVYENISGAWTQIGQDISGELDDIGESYLYSIGEKGRISLSSDGSILAIGVPNNDDNGEDSGLVRVYQNISGVWTQIGQDINGEAAGDLSAESIELSGDGSIVAIGASRNDGGGSNTGHVRVYQNISGVWTQLGSDIDGGGSIINFGFMTRISNNGNVIAASAVINDGAGFGARIVRIYENISGVWTQIGQDIENEAEYDRFGDSLSISNDGSIVAIGAPNNDGNGESSGHVRVYENISGVWTQIGQDIDGENEGDGSGENVSLSGDGNIVAISSRFNDGGGYRSGHVRIYENQSGNWVQIGTDIEGEREGDESGYSISLSHDGSALAISSILNDGNGDNSGHLRVYNLNDLLSVDEESLFNGISLYPNPTDNILNIEARQSISSIRVYNLLGQQLLSISSSSLTDKVDMSGYTIGMYLVKVEIGGQTATYKVIKE